MFKLFKPAKKDQPNSSPEIPASPESSSGNGHIPRIEPATESLEKRVIAAIRTVYDPEIPVNVYDLGLIYGICISDDGDTRIRMTLTAPACPVAGSLPDAVADAVSRVRGVTKSKVDLVFDPPWSRDLMSEAARLQLGLD